MSAGTTERDYPFERAPLDSRGDQHRCADVSAVHDYRQCSRHAANRPPWRRFTVAEIAGRDPSLSRRLGTSPLGVAPPRRASAAPLGLVTSLARPRDGRHVSKITELVRDECHAQSCQAHEDLPKVGPSTCPVIVTSSATDSHGTHTVSAHEPSPRCRRQRPTGRAPPPTSPCPPEEMRLQTGSVLRSSQPRFHIVGLNEHPSGRYQGDRGEGRSADGRSSRVGGSHPCRVHRKHLQATSEDVPSSVELRWRPG